MTLSARERAELAGSLLDTLDDAVDDNVEAAWHEEIAQRVSDLDENRAKTVSWTEVRDHLAAKLQHD
jgi:putative addiction module component (TIGR02574 family)